jgi:hypothetical protein
MLMMERVRDNTEAIRNNTSRIQAIEDQILQTRLEHLREDLKAEVTGRLEQRMQSMQTVPATQPTVIYEKMAPVYRRIETLPPARYVPAIQPTHRVQQVRQVR